MLITNVDIRWLCSHTHTRLCLPHTQTRERERNKTAHFDMLPINCSQVSSTRQMRGYKCFETKILKQNNNERKQTHRNIRLDSEKKTGCDLWSIRFGWDWHKIYYSCSHLCLCFTLTCVSVFSHADHPDGRRLWSHLDYLRLCNQLNANHLGKWTRWNVILRGGDWLEVIDRA